jgi:surfeit locus 1 family protein
MTVVMLVMFSICIKLGFWQYDKAQQKQLLQAQLDKGLDESLVELPDTITDPDAWRYRRVKFSGTYDAQYQVLLDNQVDDTVAGYHVITPVKVEGSNQHVLVNRGWVPGPRDRTVPVVEVPKGKQEIVGDIVFPPATYFTLEAPQTNDGSWQAVWQNMDIQRYMKLVPFQVPAYVVRLDPNSSAGGFVRNWPIPGARITTHLGYAYQWFGFALTLLIIYIVLNIKKVER